MISKKKLAIILATMSIATCSPSHLLGGVVNFKEDVGVVFASTEEKGTDTPKTTTKYVKCDILNVRVKPKKKSKVVGKLYWNSKVTVIGKANSKWLKVRYKNKTRYVSKEYVSSKKKKYKSYTSIGSNCQFKSYMSAGCITNTSSAQYKLKSSYTGTKNGVWQVGDRYCVALGTYFGSTVGTKYDIVLKKDDGTKQVLKCILADVKANCDTDSTHRYHRSDGSVCEFVVNTSSLPRTVSQAGSLNVLDEFNGRVVEIRKY